MRVAIITPELTNKGGVERIVLITARALGADIYTGRYFPELTFPEFKNLPVAVLEKTDKRSRFSSLMLRRKFNALRLKGYDCHIVHGGPSLAFAPHHKNIIWYCHAPTRWLYDMYLQEKNKFHGLKRAAFVILSTFLRYFDQRAVRHVDSIASNSEFTRERVKTYYGRDSSVVYPPVDLDAFTFIRPGDFFLSSARVDPIKRIDIIVEAFKQLPDQRLVVASGGPDLERIQKMAEGHPNIEVLGWVSDEKLRNLMGTCRATIYMGYKEDFGMVPVESMACGKPCIGADEGGLRESIVQGKTGFLVQPTADSLRDAVRRLDTSTAWSMRRACEARAKLFSEDKHLSALRTIMKSMH